MTKIPVILEIDQNTVKGLQFKHTFSGIIPDGMFSAPLYPDKDIYFNQVQLINFINNNFPKATGFYLNLPSDTSFIRDFSVPFTDAKKVSEIIPFEVESLLPYSLDELLFKYITYTNREQNNTDIITFGTTKLTILPYLDLLKDNNIPVVGIYSHIDSLFRFYEKYSDLKTGILLHMSSFSSVIVIICNRQWVFLRNISIGYTHFLLYLAEKLNKKLEDIEKIYSNFPTTDLKNIDFDFYKSNFSLSRNQIKIFLECIEHFSGIIYGEITLSIRSVTQDKLVGFEKNFQMIINSDSISIIPFERVLLDKLKGESIPLNYPTYGNITIQKDYFNCLTTADSFTSKKGLNFLSKDLKKHIFTKTNIALYSFYASFVLGIIFFITSFIFEMWGQKKSLFHVQEANLKIYNEYFGSYSGSNLDDMLSVASEKVNGLKRKTEIFSKFYQGKKLGEVLLNLHNAIPQAPGLEVTELSYDEKSVSFDGGVPEYDAIATMEKNILASSVFESIDCSKKKAPGDAGTQIWKFNCIVKIRNGSKK